MFTGVVKGFTELLGIRSEGSVSQDCKAKKPAKSAEVTTWSHWGGGGVQARRGGPCNHSSSMSESRQATSCWTKYHLSADRSGDIYVLAHMGIVSMFSSGGREERSLKARTPPVSGGSP